jgi:hypothetical protein
MRRLMQAMNALAVTAALHDTLQRGHSQMEFKDKRIFKQAYDMRNRFQSLLTDMNDGLH